MPKRTAHAQSEEEHRARQEEDHAQARQAGSSPAQARRRSRREGRLARLLEPWWTRNPGQVTTDIRELRAAGFRVRRAPHAGLLRLVAQKNSRTYCALYPHQEGDPVCGWVAARPADDVPTTVRDSAYHAITDLAIGRGTRRFQPFSVVLTPAWDRAQGSGGRITVARSLSGASWAALGLTGSRSASAIAKEAHALAPAYAAAQTGLWVRTARPIEERDAESFVAAAEGRIAVFHRLPLEVVRVRLRTEIAAVAWAGWLVGTTEWRFVRRDDDLHARIGHPIPLQLTDYEARAPYFSQLRTKRVVMVGCGSLGWPIAIMLARSGVRDFVLYDPDTVWSGNLARLGAGLGALGQRKVAALADTLRSIWPGIRVRSIPGKVGELVGARSLIAREPDLIVDASASERTPFDTNLAALGLGRPVVYAWSSGGVTGARVFRVRPYETACYVCVANRRPRPISQVPIGSESVWDGAHFNLEAVAAAAARMAVLTLVNEAIAPTNPDHVVLRFGGPAPRARTLQIARRSDCAVCGG